MSRLELVTTQLIGHLERLSEDAVEISYMTAFTMRSGVELSFASRDLEKGKI
ncbi:DNA/RNA helicase [Bacillus sp. OxB-1]|uniref:hypothetical protein n=1 Tax=Bacillus sp. (strain OxB-1) TaxID=98228 RepID=UPI0005821D81|nr:hypothetical protein [Bacillus sp. OxB-1]BAQ09387.1 DNA/RNA helicase [Bacillus sp. OxB-1]